VKLVAANHVETTGFLACCNAGDNRISRAVFQVSAVSSTIGPQSDEQETEDAE